MSYGDGKLKIICLIKKFLRISAKSELVFKESDFDAFVTDVINQNIKDETNRIKKFCGINVNVNSEQFKLNLSELVTEETIVFAELESCIFVRA